MSVGLVPRAALPESAAAPVTISELSVSALDVVGDRVRCPWTIRRPNLFALLSINEPK